MVLNSLKESVSFENKIIAICLMTKMPINEYVDMSKSYFGLYNKHVINELLLKRCIFNEFDTNNTLTKNYKTRRFDNFFMKCSRARRYLSNLKSL